MASTATQTQTRGSGKRGRGGHRGRGGNKGRGGGQASNRQNNPPSKDQSRKEQETSVPASKEKEETVEKTEAEQAQATEELDDSAICFICAEPIKYYSVSQCNHRTCHVCALRLRALYKKQECTFCKEPQPSVIFTTSADAPWSSYTPEAIPYKDSKLDIYFETQEMMEDSLILLRFNCPQSDCDYIANGWSDLKLHTRASHGKLMCDLCIRFKKIFAHEHTLYSPSQLPLHLPSMQRNYRPQAPVKEKVEGGVHPFCQFCRECYFSDDELYAHMREKHEECFICKRNEVHDQYFRNYDALEDHFNQAHYPCRQPVCQARKFVVFGTLLDLKAHMVEEHGQDMSAKDRKDARRIQADFEFEEVGVGGRRGRRDRGDREREREPPPSAAPAAAAGPSRAPGAPAANAGAGARRREAFGGNLTVDNANGTPNASQHPSRRQSPSPAADVDPAVLERHTAFLARISSLAPNPNGAVPAVKAAVRSYRSNESAARDLILTIWNVLDQNLEGTASIVNALVDLLDEDEKKNDLLRAWNGFKVEQRNQFPALTPQGTGTQWAGITSGRLLNAKQASSSRSAAQSSRQVLDRVARAATSSAPVPLPRALDRFPPLQASSSSASSSTPPPGFRQTQHKTPWASSSAAPAPVNLRGPTSVPGPGARGKPSNPPTLSKSAFPELPAASSGPKVPKAAIGGNQSLKRMIGDSTPSQPAWVSGSGKTSANGSGANTPGEPSTENHEGGAESAATAGTVGKKKGKGKQKQTLFTLGSFPT
ncbi:hypothetical protein K474DRAFT_1637363 [Panus rudis PR-1116 ss-1]|nr:hypothetical protein K474DRAFT_1637363 [Panus rudis PR-1116 ss-1]